MSKVKSQLVARDGIALIIVLGMLALMVLMGVTFSVYMRTERVAAGNFRNDVAVRQLLHVALNRALEDVGGSVGTGLYPSWDILPSDIIGSNSFNNALTATALEWIPRAALGTNLNPELGWIDVATGSRTEGRVGYLVVNCSGLLDANHAGGLPASDRLSGTNAAELQIETLAEVADQTKIPQGRAYETVQELGVVGLRNGTFSRHPEHFTTFSAFPTGEVVDVSGSADDLFARKTDIIAAFVRCGFSAQQAGLLFTNLIDYVDTDVLPGNVGGKVPRPTPNGPFVEPIWFCNEASLSNRVTFVYDGTNTTWTNNLSIEYECFFPFKGAMTRSGFMATLNISCQGPAYYIPDVGTWTVPSGGRGSAASPGGNQNFWRITERKLMSGIMNGPPPAPSSMVARITATISSGGTVVDVVTNVLSVTNRVLGAAGGVTTHYGWDGQECDDPRLNHNAANWKRPASGFASMNATNSYATALWSMDYRDGDLDMFVRNGPLETAGELGYLFFGAPGETIRLYKHGTAPFRGAVHPVLDHFATLKGSGRSHKGRVNLNARNPDVLACVFNGAPIDYPHGTKTRRISGTLLDNIVNAIVAQNSSFTNLSELGRAAIDWKALYPAGSSLDRESLIRNSAGLLHPRQNLFTILLFAQLTRNVEGVSDKSVVAEVRAVAEVWRDPVDDAYLVRTLKILNE